MRLSVVFGSILMWFVAGANALFTPNRMEDILVRRALHQCSLTNAKYSCLAEKAAKAMERALAADVPLFDGITLTHNGEVPQNASQARGFVGFGRLSSAVSQFLDSHFVTLDLTGTEDDDLEEETGREGDGKKKIKKKEKKYAYYAIMVLLGIFGIVGPLTLKTLALIAGKALVASKIALLIVGSVALKKIFEKDHGHSSVKIHTHTIDDVHDRLYNYNVPMNYGLEKGPME